MAISTVSTTKQRDPGTGFKMQIFEWGINKPPVLRGRGRSKNDIIIRSINTKIDNQFLNEK